jgi:tetratricopeptide (TPR) repeat protein
MRTRLEGVDVNGICEIHLNQKIKNNFFFFVFKPIVSKMLSSQTMAAAHFSTGQVAATSPPAVGGLPSPMVTATTTATTSQYHHQDSDNSLLNHESMDFRKHLLLLVQRALEFHIHTEALFYAERLLAESKATDDVSAKEEALFHLSLVHFRMQDWPSCHHLLRHHLPEVQVKRSFRCRLLLAQCAIQMKRFSEAETVLSSMKESDDTLEGKDYAEAVHLLLASICRYSPMIEVLICSSIHRETSRIKEAIGNYELALQANPFCWTAYEGLAALGSYIF